MEDLEKTFAPLILTLKPDAQSFAFFDALRQKHFPAERNFLAAHVTMFHNLPGRQKDKIEADLIELCDQRESFPLHFPKLRFLGKGAAFEIESAELNRLREQLKNRWNEWLTNQDRQKFKPHITVQNKVAPEIARSLFNELSADWSPRSGAGIGLQLWHYLNGPWKLAAEFPFE
ncbi:MAG: 2'-5' RNA ligase family protein [Acidobacteriota bacterium]